MDINCTHSCMHQREGKCTLKELPAKIKTHSRHGVDCPYFLESSSSQSFAGL